MTTPRVVIAVDLDAKAAEAGFKQLASGGKTSLTEINQGLEIASKAFGVLQSAISAAVNVVGGWVRAASESEQKQTGLERALRLAGDATGEVFAKTQALNNELLRKTGIDDDDLAATQTKLLALGVLPEHLERATKATLGLADATGKDVARAAKEVARAFEENGAEADRLTALFAVTEAKAQTVSGQFKILETQVGELGESLGGIVLGSPAVAEALDRTREHLDRVTKAVTDNAPAIQSWFDDLVRALTSTADRVARWVEETILEFHRIDTMPPPVGPFSAIVAAAQGAIAAVQTLAQAITALNQQSAIQEAKTKLTIAAARGVLAEDRRESEARQTRIVQTSPGSTEVRRVLPPDFVDWDPTIIVQTVKELGAALSSMPRDVAAIAAKDMLADPGNFSNASDVLAQTIRNVLQNFVDDAAAAAAAVSLPVAATGNLLEKPEDPDKKTPKLKPLSERQATETLESTGLLVDLTLSAETEAELASAKRAQAIVDSIQNLREESAREHARVMREIVETAQGQQFDLEAAAIAKRVEANEALAEEERRAQFVRRALAGEDIEALRAEAIAREGVHSESANRIQEIEERRQNTWERLQNQALSAVTNNLARFVAEIAQGLVRGEANAAAAAKRLLGGILSQIGQAMIALGTAAVAGGVLSTLAPAFAGPLGGPAAIPSGLALVAAGAGLVAGGAALTPSIPAGGGAGAGSSSRVSVPTPIEPRGFEPRDRDEEKGTTIININLAQGFVTGTSREIGRTIAEYLRAYGELRPSRAGGG